MLQAAIYCRISRDTAGTALGVARQEADCRARCEALAWPVAQVLIDNDLSAYSGKTRPGYQRLLEGIKAGEWNAVVAWAPDRLHRSPVELETFIDVIEAADARVVTVQAGEYDLSTPAGRMTARVVGAVARHESEHKSARLRRKHLELAEAGKVSGGGTRPFGFLSDRVTVDPVEADVIRDVARRFLAGETLRSLCVDLDARGVSTATGRPWTMPVLRGILMSPRIAGLREHHGVVVSKAVWPAIVDEVTHRRLVAVLSDPARRLNRSARRYLLTGLAVCGLCSARLVARPNSSKARCYVCASGPGFGGCGKIRALAEPLEEYVVDRLLERVEGGKVPASAATADDSELVGLESRAAELAEMFAAGEIGRAEWLTARRGLDARLERARAAVAADARSVAAQSYVTEFEDLAVKWRAGQVSFDQQRIVLARYVERVVVGPAVKGRNTFDPSRVTVDWA